MKVVLDTNVLVSGMLSANGPPARIVEAALAGDIQPVFDSRSLAEYEDVLRRPELRLPAEAVERLLGSLELLGLDVAATPWPLDLPDPDDAAFLEVAAAVACPLVTGNLRHYPARARRGVVVLSPRELVERWRLEA